MKGFFFAFVFLIYLILSAILVKRVLNKTEDWQKAAFAGVLSVFLPIVGPVFYVFCAKIGSLYEDKDFADFYVSRQFKPGDLHILQRLDPETELNRVPMSEALSLAGKEYRRKMIIGLLGEEDLLQYVRILREALENEDTETSHYASVVIMELQKKILSSLQEKEVAYRNQPDDLEVSENWERILFEVLRSELFDDFNQRLYLSKYREISDALLEQDVPPRKDLRHRIKVEIEQKNYMLAQQICTRYLALYPDSEEAVLAQLRILIDTKDAASLHGFLRTLAERPVVLTTKTLDYIRVFEKRGVV